MLKMNSRELVAGPRHERRRRAVQRMGRRAWAVPDGYAFDRNEANDRFASASVEASVWSAVAAVRGIW